MLDHIGIAVADAERSRKFYEAALAPIGIAMIMEVTPEQTESGGAAYGFGQDDKRFSGSATMNARGRGRMSPSPCRRAPMSTPFTRPRSPRAGPIMASRG